MSKIKSPGLLIRVSHLILIQILFIFGALALVLFYPQDADSPAEKLVDIEQHLAAISSQLGGLIGDNTISTGLDSTAITAIRKIAGRNEMIKSLELYPSDLNTSDTSLFSYRTRPVNKGDTINYDAEFLSSLVTYLKSADNRKITYWPPDADFIKHVEIRSAKDKDYVITIETEGVRETYANNAQGYLLLLLFLISTLISLLIINLISQGIKKPLDELIAGFEEMAAGKMYHVPEDEGDKEIRKLACSFNKMSLNLVQQQNELTEANRELLKVNKSLIDSESILTALVDFSPDAIIVTDLDDQVLIYNQAAARDFGYSQSNMMGKKISNLLPLSNLKNESSLTAQDDWEAQEIICRRRDGTRFPAMLVHTPLGPEREKPIALLYFIKNIAESEKYQDMILRLDRIASRGKMARDIAHEINNYLAILQGNLELLPIILAGNNPDKAGEKIDLMKKTVTNITTFTEGLSRFSDENSEFEKEDLNQLIENLLAFVKPQNKFDDIYIGSNLSENLPMVTIDAAQIQHLIINLVTNSAEALSVDQGQKWIIVSTLVDESIDNFYIKIADSGPGITEEHLDRLFVGRFSTKRENTGLGLITCKNIVDNHNGEISYHSSEESKAIFIIKIPIARIASDNKATEINYHSEESFID